MVRTALGIGNPELAKRIVAGIDAGADDAVNALVAVSAALAEARGDLQTAVERYADAAARLGRLGVVPEEAFALLGNGLSLVALGRHGEAADALRRARELFVRLEAAPAPAETDALLRNVTAPMP